MNPISCNIVRHLEAMARENPDTPALKIPQGRLKDGSIHYLVLSFAELDHEVVAWAEKLQSQKIARGDRVLVMVRQGLPLIAAAFALFRIGAIPIIIDPGMGLKSFLSCVERSQPKALLGISLARWISRIFRRSFRSVKIRVAVSKSATARLAKGPSSSNLSSVSTESDETAAILFTSGSTGAPKGVVYTHGMFASQVELIRGTYDIRPGEIDLPMLPIFALFNPALGMTTVVPEIDPSRPATVDPAKIVQAIRQEGVTSSFGSPTLWGKIARYCEEKQIELPSIKRILCAGAPVPPWLWETIGPIIPQGRLHSPYGATEALPVSSISADEVLQETAALTLDGRGTCVGRVIAPNQVRIIPISVKSIERITDTQFLPTGKIGEIIVCGPTVTHRYDSLPQATAKAKITDPQTGAIWHRMGDCGYLDAQGRLWFCGRMAERVGTREETFFTEQIEPIFNQHPEVRRCALIGVGAKNRLRPALVIEPKEPGNFRSSQECRRLGRELHALAKNHPQASHIRVVFFHKSLPVDVRHNAKIHRLTLAKWAVTKAIGFEIDPKR